MGNPVHHALKRQVTHSVSYAHIEVIKSHCPSPLSQTLGVAERYDKIMTQYGDCREIFSSAQSTNSEQRQDLEAKIEVVMLSARKEVVQRGRGHVTPMLHLLESHFPSMRRFGVGLGMLGEQGGGEIHAEFNLLSSTFRSIIRELD